jgi:hypothetical protein
MIQARIELNSPSTNRSFPSDAGVFAVHRGGTTYQAVSKPIAHSLHIRGLQRQQLKDKKKSKRDLGDRNHQKEAKPDNFAAQQESKNISDLVRDVLIRQFVEFEFQIRNCRTSWLLAART